MSEYVTECAVGPGYTAVAPQASGLRNPAEWFFEALGGVPSDSGERVNPRTAMGHVPVWQSINILAGDLGQLPFHKMRRDGENTGKDRQHELEYLLTTEPNSWQTPSQWKETMMAWALGWGNAICWIRMLGGRRVLWPLHPHDTSYEEVEPGEFIITSRINGVPIELRYEQCFHIRGLTDDGFWGMSAVSVLKNAIGHGLALQKHGNQVFKNGGRPSGTVSFPDSVTPSQEAADNFRSEWKERHRYPGEVAILWNGGKYMPISMSNEDAQWLEGRKLDREFVASIFNIPVFKLNGQETSATKSNMEEQQRSYFTTSLSRWTNKFTEEAQRKLLSNAERRSGKHFFRWFPEAFLRGDLKSRAEAYGNALRDRWLNPNEVRAKEDMNPYDGGDEFLNPAIDTAESRHEGGTTEEVENLIRSQVSQLLSAEANMLVNESKKSRNFKKWAGDFYSLSYPELAQKYLEAPCRVACSLGVEIKWREAAKCHARQTLGMVLAAVDSSHPDDLINVIQGYADTHRKRAQQYYQEMTEKQDD